MRRKRSAKTQNKRMRSRTAARHKGARQKPHLNEHMAMMYPRRSSSDPDNDGDMDAPGGTVGP